MRFQPTLKSSTLLLLVYVYVLVAILATHHVDGSSSTKFKFHHDNLRRLPTSSSSTSKSLALAFVSTLSPPRKSLQFRPIIGISRGIIMSASNEENGVIGGDSNEEQQQQLPPSGSFFHEVPPPKEGDIQNNSNDKSATAAAAAAIEGTISESVTSMSSSFINDFGLGDGDLEMFQQIVRKTKLSTNGSGGGVGFAKTTSTSDYTSPSIIRTTRKDTSTGDRESFVGIGMPLNDVNNPEYDSNGYTLYADEVTGEKKRVFEALVEYPSVFKMKIVGSDGDGIIVNKQQQQQQQQHQDGDNDKPLDNESDNKLLFTPSIVKVVADSCGVDVSAIQHTIRKNGKWISVTVHAPVQNADMLYSLYENVDKDPRVKFKF